MDKLRAFFDDEAWAALEPRTRIIPMGVDLPDKVDHEVDVRSVPWYRAIFDAFDTLLSTDNDVIRAVG